MFQKQDKELERLHKELLAAEEEDWQDITTDLDLEELEDYLEEELQSEEEANYEEYFDSDYEEEYAREEFYRNHAGNDGETVKNYANRYGKGSPKRFEEDMDFEDTFDDGDVLYRDDYRKSKKKKRRQNLGLIILAIVEMIAIAAIALWWASWML